MTELDPGWDELRTRALEVAERAYAPYSGLRVGAAARTDAGDIVVGCNVENASYPVGVCAEAGLVSSLHATGGGRLVALAAWSPDMREAPLMPCGSCRQVLIEAGGPDLLVAHRDKPIRLGELLPHSFGPPDLP